MKGYPIDKTVLEMQEVMVSGDVIPPQWYKHLKFENGKPYLLAILILADIVYWYRPVEVRDEITGQSLGLRKKYKADKLQRDYQAFMDKFGVSKKQVRDAINYLEQEEIISKEFRNIVISGQPINNRLYLGIYPEALKQITNQEIAVSSVLSNGDTEGNINFQGKTRPSLQGNTRGDIEGKTNTETTTKTTTESKNTPPNPKPKNAPSPNSNGYHNGNSNGTANAYPDYDDGADIEQQAAKVRPFVKEFEDNWYEPVTAEWKKISALARKHGADLERWQLAVSEMTKSKARNVDRCIEIYNAGGTWAAWCEVQNKVEQSSQEAKPLTEDEKNAKIRAAMIKNQQRLAEIRSANGFGPDDA